MHMDRTRGGVLVGRASMPHRAATRVGKGRPGVEGWTGEERPVGGVAEQGRERYRLLRAPVSWEAGVGCEWWPLGRVSKWSGPSLRGCYEGVYTEA